MTEYYVLHKEGKPEWGTAADNFDDALCKALRYFAVPVAEIERLNPYGLGQKFNDIRKRQQATYADFQIKLATPPRGTGKTEPEPEPEKKLVGYRMGKHDKVYPLHIFTPVYEEPKSTYVTRESAERAIKQAAFDRLGAYHETAEKALAMLEAKPKERVKAGRE